MDNSFNQQTGHPVLAAAGRIGAVLKDVRDVEPAFHDAGAEEGGVGGAASVARRAGSAVAARHRRLRRCGRGDRCAGRRWLVDRGGAARPALGGAVGGARPGRPGGGGGDHPGAGDRALPGRPGRGRVRGRRAAGEGGGRAGPAGGRAHAVGAAAAGGADRGGRRRLFSDAQRKAMALQHPTCRAEGCTVPATWCEAHHARDPWVRGGRTDLADGKLLCSWHHHRAHDPAYETKHLPDGAMRFHRRT